MKRQILSSAILLLSLGSCASLLGTDSSPAETSTPQATAPQKPLPSWVMDYASHPKYPLSRYMVGLGQAPVDGNLVLAGDQAVENGRLQISEVINSDLSGVTEIYMRDAGINGDTETTTDYVQEVRNKTESLFYGSTEGERYHDVASGSLYVLVVLERETHAKTLLAKVDTVLAKASTSSAQSTAAGKLRALIEEHVALEEVMPTLLNLKVVVKPNLPSYKDFEQRFSAAQDRIAAIFNEYRDANVSLKLISGNNQQGHADGSLAQPIVFEASYQGQPLVGFPVSFGLEHSSRAELSEISSQTGPSGRFSCRVVGLKLTGDEENEVGAQLDYGRLGEDIFESPSISASYALPTLSSVTFAVLVDETNEGEIQPESAVAGGIKRALGKKGVRVVAINSFLSGDDLKQATSMSARDLKSKLAGKVDYFIRGSARSKFSSTSGKVVFSYAGCNLSLIDIRTGEQLQTLEVPLSSSGVKKAGRSKEDAGTQALKALAALGEKKFMKEIDTIFQAN